MSLYPTRSSFLGAIVIYLCVVAHQFCSAQLNSGQRNFSCISSVGISAQRTQSDRGVITVGCPKIWVSDRIFTVLDGLLRDVDSMTLKNLQGLDPNSVTGADLLSIASEFQANLKYDQGAAVANAFKLQKANAQRGAELKQFDTQQKSNEAVLQQQAKLKERFLSLQEQDYQLAAAGKGTDDPQRQKIQAEETLTTTQLGDLKSLIPTSTDSTSSTPGTSITDPTISSSDTTQAAAASTSLAALDQDALQKAFGNVLQNPKLPAAMQMDNVIDLLRQRLAREFAVMYDDLSREADKYEIYLAQFDVGLIPGRSGKKQHPRVQITFSGDQAVAYDLFPVGSAYNTTTGLAKTSRIGITGAAQTLFGFGLSAAYSHSRNQYRSSLTQTLYVSAFGAGTSQFGWTFGTAPFEDFVSSGSRAVYAVLLVPRGTANLKMSIATCWLKDGRSRTEDCSTASPEVAFTLPDSGGSSQKLEALSYQPYNQRTVPGGGIATAPVSSQATSNTVQLVFTQPIDPNMTITVNDKILRRVRDVRGRALYASADDKPGVLAGNKGESDALSKSRFGILESDTLEDDTWFQVNSGAALLNISRQTAGTDTFPIIRVSSPRSAGSDLVSLATESEASVQIGEWKFNSKQLNGQRTAFSPLFTEPYDPGRIRAYVDKVESGVPSAIRIISQTRRTGRRTPVWLHDQAQVVLEIDGSPDHRWALDCTQDEGTLECKMPEKKDGSLDDDFVQKAKQPSSQLKVWVDEPPYNERPGLWADTDLQRVNSDWREQPYALTDWSDVHESCSSGSCSQSLWDSWVAQIRIKNLTGKDYCVVGVPTQETLARRERELSGEISEQTNSSKSISLLTSLRNERGQVRALESAARYNAVVSDSPKEVSQCAKAAVQVTRDGDILSLTIPFDRLPYVLDTITLERLDCRAKSAGCEDVILPNLTSVLLPGPVVLTDLKEGAYRLQGDHLKPVTKVRLVRSGAPIDLKALVGVNNVDFFLDEAPKKPTPGIYSIYLLLNQLPVPATYEDEQKKIQPLMVTIAKPEQKAPTPANGKKGADVKGTDVKSTDAKGTDVKSTDVKGTDVKGTTLRGTNVKGTTGSKGANGTKDTQSKAGQ